MKNKLIFMDLDETLIHTNLAGKDLPNEITEHQKKATKHSI